MVRSTLPFETNIAFPAAWVIACVLGLFGYPANVSAQETLAAPRPLRSNGSGAFGVNVVTRGIQLSETDLAIGPQGEPASITLVRSFSNGGGAYNSPITSMGRLGPDGYFMNNFHSEAKMLFRFKFDQCHIYQCGVDVSFMGNFYAFRSQNNDAVMTNYLYGDDSVFKSV